MIDLTLNVTLTIEGPFATKGTTVGGFGIDAVLLRDATDHAILPSSQVKGRVRDALEELATCSTGQLGDSQIHDWFGPAVNLDKPNNHDGLRPYAWHFSDFRSATPCKPQVNTRIAIDDQTGSVKTGAMLVSESAVLAGEALHLNGMVTLAGKTVAELQETLRWLARGLCWIPNFGGYRGVGYGRLIGVSFAPHELRTWGVEATSVQAALTPFFSQVSKQPVTWPVSPPPPTFADAGNATTLYDLAVHLRDPFCVGGRRTTRNILSTEKVLSGAILKGAVAFQLQRLLGLPKNVNLSTSDVAKNSVWGALCTHFTTIRFLTGMPTKEDVNERPAVLPLSLVYDSTGKKHRDAAFQANPFVFKNGGSVNAPAFNVDWKGPHYPNIASAPVDAPTIIRMHTAIDPKERRVKTNHLFAHELVKPHGLVWRGAVDLSAVPENERTKVFKQLQQFLSQALLRFGKTKARATATLTPAKVRQVPPPIEGCWALTLQSPALLADPFTLANDWAAQRDTLAEHYANYFKEVAPALTLMRFFADQDLRGGFLGFRAKTNAYNPFYITTPGSVFVVKPTNDVKVAQEEITKLQQHGLPLPKWAKDRYGTSFETNPFLPSDGFGEVAVNLQYPEAPRPTSNEIEEVTP